MSEPVVGPGIDAPIDPAAARLVDLDETATRAAGDWLAAATDADRRVVDTIAGGLRDRIGASDAPWPPLEASGPCWVAACLAVAPDVAGWMRARGVPEPVIAASLADVGRHVRLHRRHTGTFGLDAQWWMCAVLSGEMFQLGRLQFAVGQQGSVPAPVDTGPWVLHVHIPESGPLDPASVAASFARAVGFFARTFPERPVTTAVCSTWLFDPYLAAHLPPESNIVRFARLFTPYGEPMDDELDALYFVFGRRTLEGLDVLPRRSSLQRLVLDRLAAGGRWQRVRGYRALPPAG